MSGPTRWSLIRAVVAGEAAAKSEFVTRYRPIVQRYLEGQGLGSEAEDVAQEVFVRLLLKGGLDNVAKGQGSFRSYLFTVARNSLLDHLQRLRARKRGGEAVIVPLLDQEPRPEERARFDQEWLLQLLELALARLEREHPSYFRAVRVFLWEERSQADLAASAGLGVQDVRNHVHRGRKKLVAYIQEEVARYERDPGRFATEVEAVARLIAGQGRSSSSEKK